MCSEEKKADMEFTTALKLKQEAQLPQRNSASAAHMEGAKPYSPLPLSPLATSMRIRSNPKPATNVHVRQACRP